MITKGRGVGRVALSATDRHVEEAIFYVLHSELLACNGPMHVSPIRREGDTKEFTVTLYWMESGRQRVTYRLE